MLDAVVREAAERWGDATCLVAPAGWSMSYRTLDELSDRMAVGLLDEGVVEGDVVALRLPPSPQHFAAFAACAKVGAICAAINPRLTNAEQAAIVERVEPRVVIDELDGPVGRDAIPPPLVADLDRPLAIVFTSGTTGEPKGAVYTGRQIRFITEVDTAMQWGGGGPALAPTSLAHLGPMTKFAGNLMRGGTTYLLDRWSAGTALRLTAEHHMAAIAGIPTQVALMLRHRDFESTDLSAVRAVVIGGGPATPALIREIRERLGVPVSTRYSCTEAGVGLGTGRGDPPDDAEVSVGRPHAGVELSVRDPDTGAPVAAGEVGEVSLRSEAVMSGYWHDPEATAAAFWPDRFLRTGDLGYLDDHGRLRLVGRSKEMYVRGGYNVYPMEVESVLATHPSGRDVAIVSLPDGVMGEVGVAVVVATDPTSPPSLDELRAFAGATLAHHKLPETLRIVDSLPLTPMDKVDKVTLRMHVAEH